MQGPPVLIRAWLPLSSLPTLSPHLGYAALKIRVLTQVMGAGSLGDWSHSCLLAICPEPLPGLQTRTCSLPLPLLHAPPIP